MVPVFHGRKAITLRSGVLNRTIFIFGFPVPETLLHTFFGTRGYFRVIYRAEKYFGSGRSLGMVGNHFGSVSPKQILGTKQCVKWGFRDGKFEYESCFGIDSGA